MLIPRNGLMTRAENEAAYKRLQYLLQLTADEHGETVLLIAPGHPNPISGFLSNIPYGTLKSQADDWEIDPSNILAEIHPSKKEA